jgi:hypothetical protein
MFLFVFSAGFVLVECTYLLLWLLSCSSNNEVRSWPLLLLLIEFSQTPAPSALLSPYSERERKRACVRLCKEANNFSLQNTHKNDEEKHTSVLRHHVQERV